jgi:hypothetical protein
MRESVIGNLIWIVGGILANVCMSTATLADSIESKPVLVFRIVNSAQVSEEVLNQAQQHAEKIYRKSGIRIEWLTGNEIPETLVSTRRLLLRIHLVNDDVARRLRRPDNEAGFAISNDGQGARCAYVFVDRAEQQAEMVARLKSLKKERADALILGYVIAHEAGHLMLAHDSHTITGIMRARMDMSSLELAIQGRLMFQPEQSKSIQATLMAQSGF